MAVSSVETTPYGPPRPDRNWLPMVDGGGGGHLTRSHITCDLWLKRKALALIVGENTASGAAGPDLLWSRRVLSPAGNHMATFA